MTPVLAHAGDWILGIVYMTPLIVLTIGLTVSTLRARREQGDEEQEAPPEPG